MQKFGSTEKAMLYVAMIVLMAFSYFLYDDSLLFPKSNTDKLELIGDVSSSQNDVRRKNLDTFSWLPAAKKDKIYQNDSIYTGDRSQALIQLSGGTQISVQPNSLVTLNLKNGQMNLDLRYGNFVGELAQGTTLKIKSGGEEFDLEGGANSKVEFKKAHSGTVDLKLLSGDVKYINRKKQSSLQLQQNSQMAVSAKGVQQVEKTVLTLKTADNTSWMRENPDDPLPFEWTSKGPARNFELEVSPTADFSTVAVSQVTKEGLAQVTEPLAEGNYHWRVKAYGQDGQVAAVSDSHKMSISHLAGPRITSPTPQAQLDFSVRAEKNGESPRAATQLNWEASPVLKKFQWQIAQDPEFTNVIAQKETDELSDLTAALPAGDYWVRVQGQTEAKKVSPWSPPVPFTLNITAKKMERPLKPVLITKSVEFTPPDKDRNPASPEAPKIAWKPVLQTKGYQIQIASDPSFADAQKFASSKTELAWDQYRPGKYFYRVFAQGMNGAFSESSEVGTMDVAMSALTLNPLKPLKTAKNGPQAANVTWSEVPFAKTYIVQVDKNQDFSAPQQLAYQSNAGLVTLPDPGRYNIRVQALDENSKPVTSFSNIEEVIFNKIPTLTPPLLVEPFNNASIFLQTEMEPFLWLEWKKVKGAALYRIEISDKPDFSHILISQGVDSNRYLIKDRVPMGKLFWRVRAEIPSEAKDQQESSDWTEKREFTLYHQKNEAFVK